MQGLTLLQHHHIGDVHHSVYTVDASPFQTLLNPGRRDQRAVNALDQGDAIQPSGLHRLCTGGRRLQRFVHRVEGQIRECQLSTRQGRHFPGDADHRQTIRTVGGDCQLQDGVIKTEQGCDRLSQCR